LGEPGVYGVWITVEAKGGKAFTCRHVLVRLPKGEAEPEDVSQAAALRWLAARELGRAWTQDDASLFTYAAKWWWRMERAVGKAKELEWFALYPPGYDEGVKAGTRYPVYVDMHGSGATQLEWERFKADPYFRTFEAVTAEGWVVVLPQSRGQWNPWAVLDLLDRVEAVVPVERSRVVVGGHSMGASGVWRLLDAAPERFAAAVMVAGGNVPPVQKVKRFTGLPLWVVFGERDNPDGQARSETMVAAINAAGGQARYTRMPGANHMQSRNVFFAEAAWREWLGAQRRDGR
jgi:predicted peptidase